MPVVNDGGGGSNTPTLSGSPTAQPTPVGGSSSSSGSSGGGGFDLFGTLGNAIGSAANAVGNAVGSIQLPYVPVPAGEHAMPWSSSSPTQVSPQVAEVIKSATNPAATAPKTAAQAITGPTPTGGSAGGVGTGAAVGGLGGAGGGTVGTTPINTNDLLQQATQAVNASLNPQLADLSAQQKYLESLFGSQAGQMRTDETNQTNNIQRIYDALQNSLTGLNTQQQGQWAQTQGQVGQNYQDLQNQLAALFQGQQNDLAGHANSLGLGAALPQGTAGLQNTGQLLQGLADVGKTNVGNILTTEKQGFNNLGLNEAQQAQSTGAERISALQNATDKQINTMRDKTDAQLALLSSKMTNLSAAKNPQIAALYQKLLAQKETLDATAAYRQATLGLREQQLGQGQQRIDISNQSLQDKMRQETLLNPLRARYLTEKINTGGTGKTNAFQNAANIGENTGGNVAAMMQDLLNPYNGGTQVTLLPQAEVTTALTNISNNPQAQQQSGLNQAQLYDALQQMWAALKGQ